MITIAKASSKYTKGDDALIGLFQKKEYDAVATDDAKLARHSGYPENFRDGDHADLCLDLNAMSLAACVFGLD